jgi:tripartite ATP-independent transporter DctP family solute receptor
MPKNLSNPSSFVVHHLLSFLLVSLLAACGGGSADDAVLELKLGHVAAPGSLVAACAEEFARVANERLAGKAKVVVFGSSQLGSDEILLQKLKLGTVEFALPSTIMSSIVDAFGLFEMPYLIKDREQMKLVEEQIFWPHLAPLAEEKGLQVLAVWENGFRHITNSSRPIVVPGDLSGIKLRTPRGRWRIKLFQSFGANPTPMALSEVFIALQTGVMDGQENPLAQIYSSKFQEVQTYLSLTSHVYTPTYVVVGKNHFQKLPADVRKALERTARETQGFVHATGERMDVELLEKLSAAGVKVNEADRDAFRKASTAIYEQFGSLVPGGKEWIETALALAGS